MNFDVDIIFKIAAIGIIVAVLNQVLIRAGREDISPIRVFEAPNLIANTPR